MVATLHVSHANNPAVSLYRSIGFQDDGLLDDYYGHGQHAKKMMLDLVKWKNHYHIERHDGLASGYPV
eukprot:353445-Chlamydomonas_euryale.AAC.15